MHTCDIHQYLVHQNVFCTILPNITLANISSYMVTLLLYILVKILLIDKSICQNILRQIFALHSITAFKKSHEKGFITKEPS